ncbi:chromate efflux transporter [Anderseniella sp. Alg231-50]|uniref:chromate efflux transporter n=1 Tax=Anderseniella sp. Alg231-50 TaxID=1922226 RepID=UPI000D55B958
MTNDPSTSFREAMRVFARIGCLSFGGPAGQIALMHRELVEQRPWLSEQDYLRALNFCMLLPGPEAMQLATYAGWRLHGVRGGLMAGLLFVLPGAAVVLVISVLYSLFGRLPLVEAVFFGIKAAVLAIVLEALLKVSRRALNLPWHWMIAIAAFLALFVFNIPFPAVIVVAGITGYAMTKGQAADTALHEVTPVPALQTVRTIATWLVIWFTPIAVIALVTYPDHLLVSVGLFFSKLAVVTFGGAYAVLAYMGQQAVENHGWLTAPQMVDGLGLAETTPGPLILVTEFVGYMAGFRASGLQGSVTGGLAAAAVALWVTFAPCFLWIFAGAPYIERLANMPRLSGALSAITAGVVGVIANLALWFGLHVLFGDLTRIETGPVTMTWPVWSSVSISAVALFMVSAVMLLKLHAGLAKTLGVCAILGALIGLMS